jgi:F0F1-type ATP synthase assembly protein I
VTSSRSDNSDQTPHQEGSNVKDLPGLAALAAMGTTLAGCEAIGVLLGLYLDHLWSFAPWGLLMGIVLGTVAAVASVVQLVRRFL